MLLKLWWRLSSICTDWYNVDDLMKPHGSVQVVRVWCGIRTNPVLRCFDNPEGLNYGNLLLGVGHSLGVRACQDKCLSEPGGFMHLSRVILAENMDGSMPAHTNTTRKTELFVGQNNFHRLEETPTKIK
jgi:hypothetical protein